jgi:ribosome-binding factor A
VGRKERVESALRERLAELITREIKDPRVSAAGVLGVSKVECTQDLSVAKVWVSIYADDKVAEKAITALNAAAGFLRGPLGRSLNLVRPPELRFARDVTAEMAIRLRAVVQDDEARARAVGREPGEAPAAPASASDAEPGDAEPADVAAAAELENGGAAAEPDVDGAADADKPA